MQILLLSDIHFELFSEESGLRKEICREIASAAGTHGALFLGGDIFSMDYINKMTYWKRVKFVDEMQSAIRPWFWNDKPVFVVGGNHELWGTRDHVSLPDPWGELREIWNEIDHKVHWLDGTHPIARSSEAAQGDAGKPLVLHGYNVVGCSYFTNIPPDSSFLAKELNDSRNIRTGIAKPGFVDDFWNPLHAFEHRALVGAMQACSNNKILCMTHMPPKSFVGDGFRRATRMDCFFYNTRYAEQQEFFESDEIRENSVWLFGHTHNQIDANFGGWEFHSRPVGYLELGENPLGLTRNLDNLIRNCTVVI